MIDRLSASGPYEQDTHAYGKKNGKSSPVLLGTLPSVKFLLHLNGNFYGIHRMMVYCVVLLPYD